MAAAAAVAGHLNPATLAQTLDRVLDDAQHTGIVDLSSRNLKEFPHIACDYDLADTVETNLSKNRFHELPREICLYLSSEVLNCYHNCLRSVPEAILNLQQLTYLNLSRNQLTQLPSYICQLQSLEVLLIRSNRLTALPEQLGLLGRLAELDSSWNELEHVPSELSTLSNLRSLDLAHNALLDVPPELCKLKLRSLDLSSNQIQYIPLEYRAMDTLDRLSLDNNPLVCPPAHICTKGRVHIMKYLHIVALREEKRKGSLTAAGSTDAFAPSVGESGRRSIYGISGTDECDAKKVPALGCDARKLPVPAGGTSSSGAGPPTEIRFTRPGRAGRALTAIRQPHEQPQRQSSDNGCDVLNGDLSSGSYSRSLVVGNGSSGRLSPVMLATTARSYGSGAPTSLSLIEPVQYYATATPPPGTPAGADSSTDELLRQKQEYDVKRRKVPATAGELKQHPKAGDKDRLLASKGNSSASALPEPGGVMPWQPCSAPAHLGSLHVKPSPSTMSDVSQTDTLLSIDSLNGFPAAGGTMSRAADVWSSDVAAKPLSTISAKARASARADPASVRCAAVGRSGNPRHTGLQPGQSTGSPSVSVDPSQPPGMVRLTKSVQQASNGLQLPSAVSNASGSPGSSRGAEMSTASDGDQALGALKEIVESRLKIKLSDDLPNALRDGVVLCLLVNHVRPRSVLQIHMPTAAVPKLTMAQCRRNVDNFIHACRRLGVPEEDLCTVADVLDHRLPGTIAKTVESLCRLCEGPVMAIAARTNVAAPVALPPAQQQINSAAVVPTSSGSDRRFVTSSSAGRNSFGGTAIRTPLPDAKVDAEAAVNSASTSTQSSRIRKPPQSPSAV